MLMAIDIQYCFTDVLVVVYDWIYTIFMFIQLVTTTPCKMLVSNLDNVHPRKLEFSLLIRHISLCCKVSYGEGGAARCGLYYYYHGYYGIEICRLAARRSDETIVIPG